jgi:hypothetical protein
VLTSLQIIIQAFPVNQTALFCRNVHTHRMDVPLIENSWSIQTPGRCKSGIAGVLAEVRMTTCSARSDSQGGYFQRNKCLPIHELIRTRRLPKGSWLGLLPYWISRRTHFFLPRLVLLVFPYICIQIESDRVQGIYELRAHLLSCRTSLKVLSIWSHLTQGMVDLKLPYSRYNRSEVISNLLSVINSVQCVIL